MTKSFEISTKPVWAIFKLGEKYKFAKIYGVDDDYLYFESKPDNIIYHLPKKDIIAKGSYQKLFKKYPEYMI